MDIEYYRNFIAIVEAGSISAAAKQIAIAQPVAEHDLLDLVVLIKHRIMRGIIVGCTCATQQQFPIVVENIVDVFPALSGR